MSMHVRRDIQGLRAVAVLAVILFHAGLPIPGGFAGVDVFFVISGFVITSLLLREQVESGRLSLRRFYLRRLKRLAPALAVVVFMTLVLGSVILSVAGSLQSTAMTGAGAMLGVSNWVIAATSGGYFDAPAATNALLNTWSLAVEEQFYVIFPSIVALSFLARGAGSTQRGTKNLIVAIAVVSTASLGAAVIFQPGGWIAWSGQTGLLLGQSTPINFPLGFYGPIARLWEFGVGAILSALLFRRQNPGPLIFRKTASVAGTLLLVISFWAFSATTPFPGPATLVPVIGTAALLWGGSGHETTIWTRVLGNRFMVGIGDASYSLYLWHWPLIVLSIAVFPELWWVPLVATLVSMAPALASFRFVENPIRFSPRLVGARGLTVMIAIVIVPLATGFAINFLATHIVRPGFESGSMAGTQRGDVGQPQFLDWISANTFACSPRELVQISKDLKPDGQCRQSMPSAEYQIAVIGDSHAQHLLPGLVTAFPDSNILFFHNVELPTSGASPQMDQVLNFVASSPTVKTVILNARWDSRGVPASELRSTLVRLANAGKTVYLTDDVPHFPFDAFSCKYPMLLTGQTRCNSSARDLWEEHGTITAELAQSTQGLSNVHVLSTFHYFCTPSKCNMTEGNTLLFRDQHHLSIPGSIWLINRMVTDNPNLAKALVPSHS